MTEHHVKPTAGTVVVSWGLIAMSLLVLAAGALLPEWRELHQLRDDERKERLRFAHMRQIVDAEEKALWAVATQPAVTARLAQRDLGFRRGNTRVEDASVPVSRSASARRFSLGESGRATGEGDVLPPGVVDVFCERESRMLLIVLSAMLMGLGVVLPAMGERSKSS